MSTAPTVWGDELTSCIDNLQCGKRDAASAGIHTSAGDRTRSDDIRFISPNAGVKRRAVRASALNEMLGPSAFNTPKPKSFAKLV
jgi:hypothetical protein